MRVSGRQKGSKIKPYTHIVVQPDAPKSRYTFSYHSSEAGAKAAVKKYERMVGNPLRVVKQSGKSANTDVMESKTSDLIKKSQAKRGAPGTLKRKVSGKMTIAKAQALKNKPGATTLDKKQANFFINMARARNEEMDQQAENLWKNVQESLWANIHAKRRRGEKMRKKGAKGAPTPDQIKRAQAASKNEDLNEKPYLRTHPTLKNLRLPVRRKSGKVTGLSPKKKTANEMMTTGDAGIPQDTKNMGPRLKTTVMHDRRRRKDKLPVLLKRFRKYMDDHYG